jgi:hypothetical protein
MDYSKYQNTLPFPKRTDFTKVFVYDKGYMIFEGSYAEFIEFKKKAPPGFVRQERIDEEKYKALVLAYHKHNGELEDLFKKDLFEENGVTDNPKAEKAFEIAWEERHSGGLSDVACFFSRLTELI